MNFPPVPTEVKAIAHFLKVADEHHERNIVVSYWCCMYAVQYAMRIVPGNRPPEVTRLLVSIMDWLEKTKNENGDLDGINSEAAAHALIEEHALKLFNFAETQDQAEVFDKNTIKLFYTSSILMDILQQFGELPDDITDKRKYAKWRAAYIHNCLKNGEQPISGNAKILYTKEEEDNFKDFMSKEEFESMKERENQDNQPSSDVTPQIPLSPPATPPTWASAAVNEPNEPEAPAPIVPPRSVNVVPRPAAVPNGNETVGPEAIEKAQKYCKWASSALNYEDVTTAITNIEKALHLLKFGEEM